MLDLFSPMCECLCVSVGLCLMCVFVIAGRLCVRLSVCMFVCVAACVYGCELVKVRV